MCVKLCDLALKVWSFGNYRYYHYLVLICLRHLSFATRGSYEQTSLVVNLHEKLWLMYESNPRMPIPPPVQPPGIWHELSPGGKEFDICSGSGTPGHLTPWKKRRNTLCIPRICININRDSSVKDCFQFYFVTTRVQWSIENKNKY